MAVTIKINPCPQRYNSANPYKTGQTTSYVSNDDGDLQRGRGSDFTTLDFNNPFGNTNRFTDTLGGQTYANDIVIDWATTNYIAETVIGWYRVVQGGAGVNWTTAMSGQPYTIGSYNDWYIPDERELTTIVNLGLTEVLNYSPFSLNSTTSGNGIWTSTTNAGNTANAYRILLQSSAFPNMSAQPKAAATLNYIVLRDFTFAELGL